MKRPHPQRWLEIDVQPDGFIQGVLPRSGIAEIGLVLDGTLQSVRAVEAGRFSARLPAHLMFRVLEVVALPDGTRLLPQPVVLDALYGVVWNEVSLAGRVVSGSFRAAAQVAPLLGIVFEDGGVRVAAGLARRAAGQDDFQFSLPLLALPRPGGRFEVRPKLAGLLHDAPMLVVAPAEVGFAGCLDTVSAVEVTGWALNLAQPRRRARLDVLVDGHKVATVTADRPRDDVAALYRCDARCGFSVALPPAGDDEAARLISVRIHNEEAELTGSPCRIGAPRGLLGCFDNIHGMAAHGWAVNMAAPNSPVTVEIVGPDGEVLGSGLATQFRGDLLDAGYNGGLCAFKVDLSAQFDRLIDRDIVARFAGTQMLLAGSPQRARYNVNIQALLQRKRRLRAGVLPRLRRALDHLAGECGISFIMGVYNTPRAWLIEALESVRGQYCGAWELICVDDGSTEAHVREILASYEARDARVRVLRPPQNVGIAKAVNFALRVAKYPYVAFMDHDDRLEPDAAWQLIRAAKRTQADLLYSDEAQCAETIEAVMELRLRPAFSHDYYLSHPYFVHIVCARTDLARRIGGYDETMRISADVDFVLRMIEVSKVVTHVPAVLYRWRTHAASSGYQRQDEVMAASIGALQRHLDRLGTGARARAGVWFNQFLIDWPAASGKILIVIPTKNRVDLVRVAVDSIERTASGAEYRLVVIDHQSDDAETLLYLDEIRGRHVVMPYEGAFNFSRMNNMAVAAHGGDCAFVLFLNNDVEATQDGWLQRLRDLAHRRDVGAVGALLMYANKTVQHAGVIFGFNSSADHAMKFQNVFLTPQGRRNLGYNCALSAVRDYSAVTAACLMMRKSVFDEIHGFDENYVIGFNDTDLCLRITRAGYRILYDGNTMLYHYESATRATTRQVFHPDDTARMLRQWGSVLTAGDPFYHPHLSLAVQDHVPREEPGCTVMHKARACVLDLGKLREKNVLF